MKDEKILQEETLSNEELDNVAGGNSSETADDSHFLNVLTGKCDRYGEWIISREGHTPEIEKAWAFAGVEAHLNSFNNGYARTNKYKRMDTGESLTQEQARQYAMNYLGRHLTDAEWGKGGSW